MLVTLNRHALLPHDQTFKACLQVFDLFHVPCVVEFLAHLL
jgi:hypothetical protein